MINSVIIGLGGCSGSGKTTVSRIIQSSSEVTIISLDNFYKGLLDEDKLHPELYNFDEPGAIDFEYCINCLKELKMGNSVSIPVYDFKTHSRLEDQMLTIVPNKIIILEGILIYANDDLRKLFDVKIYVEATEATCIFRRLERDIRDRGRTLDFVRGQYKMFVEPAFHLYIEPYKKQVDLIIYNNDHNNFIGVKILSKYINNILLT